MKFCKNSFSKAASIAVLAGVVTLTSACGGDATGNQPAPSETATVAAPVAETTTPTPSAKETSPIGVAAPTGELVTSPHGDYLQSTIDSNDPAMSVVSTTLDPSVADMDQLELILAQQTIVKYMAEQGIDSTLNGAVTTVDEWWAKNKGNLSSDYQDEIYQTLKDGKPFVMNEKWQQEKYGDKYQYVTSPDKPRIYDRTITVTNVWKVEGTETIAVKADVSYKMPVVPGIGETKSGVQTTAGTMTYSVSKNPATGKWLIDGFDHDMQTTEG